MRDVVIVGAGPVGLSLALGLSRAGKSVLVLEKKSDFDTHSRAPAIWPRTQEILAKWGILDSFLNEGQVLKEGVFWDADSGKPLLRLPLYELASETKFPQLLVLQQPRTERILFEALQKQPSAQILFSAEVTEIRQDDSKVYVTYKKDGRIAKEEAFFTAGCDGAHSKVREVLGFSLEGITYGTLAALADVRLAGKSDYPFPLLSTREVFVAALRIEKDLWRLILPVRNHDKMPLDERIARSVKGLFAQDRYELVWKSEFRLHRRMSKDFVVGRIALAGDAAHLNSPVGGQGMNSGIQDAYALSLKMARALETGSPEPLKDYEADREKVIGLGVNAFTNQMTRILFFENGKFVKLILKLTNLILKLPALRRKLMRRMTMIDSKLPE